MEHPDIADWQRVLDGTLDLDQAKEAGIPTDQAKKFEVIETRGEHETVIRRKVELHDRSAQAFDQIMDRTGGKPRQEVEQISSGPQTIVIVAAGNAPPAQLQANSGVGAGLVDVSAVPAETPVMADSGDNSQIEAKTAQLGGNGGSSEPPDGVMVDENGPEYLSVGQSFIGLMDGTIRDQFVLVESRRGTGKTRAILTALVKRALDHPGSRWLVVRSSRTRLTDSAIATFVDQVLPSFGLPVPKCQREQISTYTLPNGSQFIFQGLDDPSRQQSVECAGVYVVEGVEIPEVDTITALAASMRQACTPPIPFYQCIVDCNPGSPSHPLNQIAEPMDDSYRITDTRESYERCVAHNRQPSAVAGKWKRIITHYADNPGYFDVIKWVWTVAGEQYIKTLEWLTGHLKKRWYYGLWSAAEGSVFGDVFDEAIHVVDDFDPPPDWPEYDGWDPGIDHVTGIPFTCVAPNGDIYVRDEIYEGGKSIAEHVHQNVQPRVRQGANTTWFGDPHHFFSSTAQSPKSCADQAQEAGLSRAIPWADLRGAAKQHAVNAFLQLLQNTVVYEKTGVRKGVCVYFMRKCKNAIMECQTWSYKRNAKGERPDGDDAYQDRDNHLVGDPLVGMIATGRLKYAQSNGTTVCENG
jgi:hypothetical protein